MSLMMKESQESVVGRKIPVCAPPPPTLLQAPFRSRFSPLALAQHPTSRSLKLFLVLMKVFSLALRLIVSKPFHMKLIFAFLVCIHM